MIYKKIHDELYGVDLLYFSGCTIEEAQKKANRVFNIQEELSVERTDEAVFFSVTTKDNRTIYIIWIKNNKNIATITHEVSHLVYEVFRDRGIPSTYQNQESFAYYLAFWVEQIIKPRASVKAFKKKR